MIVQQMLLRTFPRILHTTSSTYIWGKHPIPNTQSKSLSCHFHRNKMALIREKTLSANYRVNNLPLIIFKSIASFIWLIFGSVTIEWDWRAFGSAWRQMVLNKSAPLDPGEKMICHNHFITSLQPSHSLRA